MHKITFVASLLFVLSACSGSGDFGTTITHVNKMMPVFDSDGVGVIYSAQGKGQIENIYLCGDMGNWHHPGNTVLNVYCDDSLCVSGKIYELACLNMDYVDEREYEKVFLETPLFSKFGAHNSISLDFKIPYYKSCRVELVQAVKGEKDYVWTTVRASSKPCVIVDGRKLPAGARFKALRTPDQTLASGEQYTLMETSSRHSMLLGVNLFLNSETECTMEACLRAINTLNDRAVLLSSGLEDFFLGTYYFDSGQFLGYKCGQTCLKLSDGGVRLSAYRQFPDNPLCFNSPVRLTVRAGEQNEIDSDSAITSDIYAGRGSATYGGICFRYEW